ncbi:MAG TPA: isochorismatase family protein [Terriglobales bacterium]|nr:isochorismatase family protein [Terriglobales bacterium]
MVIDMQARLVPAITAAPAVVRACRRAIRALDLLAVPVIFTEQYPQGLGPTVEGVAELFGERRPVAKTSFGCFNSDAFAQALEQSGRRSLLLCGIEAHICVFQTAVQALRRGFAVYLLEDAIGARTVEAHRSGLARLALAGAVPSHTEMAIYEHLGTAGSKEFRSVLAIIKEESGD